MPQTVFSILGEEFRFECAANEERRLRDLAAALDERLQVGEGAALARLVAVALSLLDEAQASGAALARARGEIERLSDELTAQHRMARLTPGTLEERGRLAALSRWRAP